jgi:excisionase family DNA binding protein
MSHRGAGGVAGEILTVRDLARYLRLPVSTAYRLVERRDVPGFKLGRQWRFHRPALDRWFARKAVTRTVTVLVVDDDPAICDLFASALGGEDRRVLTATDGERALDLARQSPITIAVLDLIMPGLDGVEIFRRLRAVNAQLPVIFVTGYPDSSLLQQALMIGSFTVLAKPVGVQRLRSAVGMLVRSGSLSPSERGLAPGPAAERSRRTPRNDRAD